MKKIRDAGSKKALPVCSRRGTGSDAGEASLAIHGLSHYNQKQITIYRRLLIGTERRCINEA